MDPLSEICTSIRVKDALFTRVEASTPWGIKSDGESGFKFVLVLGGSCTLRSQGGKPTFLTAGDAFIELEALPYEIYDAEGATLVDCKALLSKIESNTIEIGGEGPKTTFLSGVFELDSVDSLPLLEYLPSLLYMRAGREANEAFEAILEMLGRESATREVGAAAIIARLFEILFIHTVRHYCVQEAPSANGWLGVMADPQLSKAGYAMHQDLGRDWTLEMMAQEAGMSRTSFATRFRERAKQTPLDYLTRWRMHKAARLMRAGNQSLGQIARAVGYKSEAAFNRSFVKQIGVTPGKYRRQQSDEDSLSSP
ncbi:AraC family transcriptional regulator [Cupriavidus sp. 2SB]|uniref:AraC family transcriptional regulator n=1 Tax=Cupriavidus sp. 2SB TaxID=2502199 RepID=UPI001485396A|nr:AraC family transcriptional regulator [Cupriavidus sp. 2SB]